MTYVDDHRLLLELHPVYAEIDQARRDAEHTAGLTHDNHDCQQCLATRAARGDSTALLTFGGVIVRVVDTGLP